METPAAGTRDFILQLVEWVRGKGRILVVTHDNPDPDALASAYALQHLLLVTTGREAVLSFGGVIGRSENRVMVEELEIRYVPLSRLDLDDFEVVCMVDTQPGTGNNSWPVQRPVHVVIDHHPLREVTRQSRWVDVRDSFGACATILFEYLRTHEVYIGTKLATMLFYAIKSETQDLGRDWIRADRDAYLSLLAFCNNRILARITRPPIPRGYFAYANRAIEGARVYGPVLVFNLYELDSPDLVAEMAEFLVRAEGIETALGIGRYGEVELLSMRTRNEAVAAGEVLQAVAAGLGSAGGHAMTAGGQIPLPAADRAAQLALTETLTHRLLERLGVEAGPGHPLLSA